MTDEQRAELAELLELEKLAAAGPWGSKCSRKYCSKTYHADHKIRNDRKKGQPLHEDGSVGHEIAEISGGGGAHKANADLICRLRNAAPWLLKAAQESESYRLTRLAALEQFAARRCGYQPGVSERPFENYISDHIGSVEHQVRTRDAEISALKARLAEAEESELRLKQHAATLQATVERLRASFCRSNGRTLAVGDNTPCSCTACRLAKGEA